MELGKSFATTIKIVVFTTFIGGLVAGGVGVGVYKMVSKKQYGEKPFGCPGD